MSKKIVKLHHPDYSKGTREEATYKYSFSEIPVEGEIEDMPDSSIYEFIKNPRNRSVTYDLPFSWQRPDGVEYHQYRDGTDVNVHAFWEAPWMLLIGVIIGGIITLVLWILVKTSVIKSYDSMWWVLLGGFLTLTWAVVITWGNRKRLSEAWTNMHRNIYYSLRDKIETEPTKYLLNKSRFNGKEYYDPNVSRFTMDEYFDRLKTGGFTDLAENQIEYQKCRNYPERNELMRHISYLGTAKSYLGEMQVKAQKIAV